MPAYLYFVAALVALCSATELRAGPCTTDADCGTGTVTCCKMQSVWAGGAGTCIDTRYEKCCANTGCYKYQKCCNNTCCSGRESCRSASTVEGDRDTCSAIEKFDGFREYTSLGVPITLGLGALAAYIFAFALLRTHRVRFTAPVALVVVTSFFCWIWALLLLISMHAMPAFLLCAVSTAALASLAAIAPAHAPTQVLTVVLAAVAASFLMMINPFASNSLFSFDPMYAGQQQYGGVLGRALTHLSPEAFARSGAASGSDATGQYGFTGTCTTWYNGYWRRDPALYADYRIHDPAVRAEPRGLCGRPYLFYIAVISTFETLGLPLLFLALVARLWEVRGATRAERVAPEAHAHSGAHTTPSKAPATTEGA